jgi:Leucine-rich repeat (LRR) protein/GTPase SAR1 family protein
MSSISNISRNVEVHHTDDLAASASTDQLLEVVKQTKLNDQTFVYFGNKGLTVLPADLDLLQHLTHLNLESNLLTGLPSQIARLVNLVNLELNNNRISSIPNDIVGLCSLLHLNLDNNRIGYLPSTLGKLTSLRTLKINKNQLSSEGLDPIFTLHRLEHLEIGDNQLEEIPPMISHLASLKILNLAGNKLTQLPECINTLTQLSKLLIERNQIDEFPSTIGNATTLTEICVAQNCISELPETFPQLTGLRKLDLSSNLLYSFGSGFLVWALTNLTELNLIKSRLPDLPPEIANLCNLVQLNLESNSIESLPPEIGKLTALKRLNLANNKLVTLPNEMESLTKLQYLMLNHNKLEWLPYQLGNLDLKKLEVVGNPLETIPEEIVKKGMTHIIGYLRELRGSKTSWNRLKLVFVGQEFVGKTSLLRCFTAQVALKSKQTFRSVRSKVPVRAAHTGDTLATDGIDIAEWNPRIRIKGNKLVSILNTEASSSAFSSTDKLKSKKSILTRDVRSETSVNTTPEEDLQLKFSAWDFAGQEIYYPTHQFFISPRSIYLIVFNMVDEQSSRVEYWLNTVQSRAANPTVILVGTHLDDKRCTSTFIAELQSSFEERYKKRFPCIKAVTFVSCHTSKGLEELKDTLINTALKEKVLSQRVPLSYLMMAQVVEKEKKTRPILRWSTFEKMALNAGISEDGIEIATEFLHDVGVLIHFKDPLLKDFVFLNPQYLANVMSSVITLKHQFVKDGLLKHSNLPHIWSHYPQENYPLLLKVLQKFEIMFKMPSENSEEVSLIPSLLPVEQPAGVAEQWPSFWPETSLSRVYQFKFLPLGFFSRLMTRALHLPGLTPLFYWSTGVLVQYENVKALIKYSANNYKLTLIVRSATENSSPPLLRLLVENIDTLVQVRSVAGVSPRRNGKLTFYYFSLLRSLSQGWYEAKVQVSVICSHCLAKKDLSYDPFQFSLDECSEAVRTGHGVVMCRGIRPVRVDYIAPDISFQDFPGRKIPYEDIQTSKILGKGAFGTVLLGILDGEEIAVKVMHDGPAEPGTDEANNEAAEGFAEFQREVFIMRFVLLSLLPSSLLPTSSYNSFLVV